MPRTFTIEKTVYKYDELTERAKDNAVENLYALNVDYEWWDSVYEDAKMVGIKITEFDIDRGAYCNGDFTGGPEETAHYIVDSHGEQCETYKTAEQYLKDRDNIIDTAEKDENGEFADEYALDVELDELDNEFKKSILEDYRIMLSKEYDYLTSREAIEETIRINEYEFDENGKLA